MFAANPFKVIVPSVPPQVVGSVDEVPLITGVGGLLRVTGPTAADVQLFVVAVMLEYVPADRPVMITMPDPVAVIV